MFELSVKRTDLEEQHYNDYTLRGAKKNEYE